MVNLDAQYNSLTTCMTGYLPLANGQQLSLEKVSEMGLD